MKPVKVAIIYGGSKTGGGVDTYLTNLFEYADKKGAHLELISLGEWTLTKELSNKEYGVRVYAGRWWNLVNVFKIASYLKKEKFNLIVSSGMVANFYARKASAITGIPSLITIHSDWRTDYQGLKKIIYLFSDRLLRLRTKEYIAVSNYLKRQLVREGIKEDKIAVIYNGLRSSHTSYSIPHTSVATVIGSVGRLHPVKNYRELILAVGELVKEGVDVSLEIAGDGAERERLEQIIEENGLSENVKLLGWVKELTAVRASWDVYVQSSLTEGFGIALVEAMFCGLPVVVTPGGALPELVSDGETGIVATGFGHEEIAEALKRIISNRENMQKMAQNGQKFVADNFGIEKWAKDTIEVYKKVAK